MATAKAAKATTVSTPRKRAGTAKPKAEAKPAAKAAPKSTTAEAKAKTPRKSAPKPAVAPEMSFSEQVSRLAYQYWEERGCPAGSPHEDWFRAEQELSRT